MQRARMRSAENSRPKPRCVEGPRGREPVLRHPGHRRDRGGRGGHEPGQTEIGQARGPSRGRSDIRVCGVSDGRFWRVARMSTESGQRERARRPVPCRSGHRCAVAIRLGEVRRHPVPALTCDRAAPCRPFDVNPRPAPRRSRAAPVPAHAHPNHARFQRAGHEKMSRSVQTAASSMRVAATRRAALG